MGIILTKKQGLGGFIDHSKLSHLDYESSGHTGFAAEDHTHDDRYHRILSEKFTLDANDILNKYIELSTAPATSEELCVFVYEGPKGELDIDYIVSDNKIDWSGKEWDGLLEVGDLLSILYWY